MTDPNDPMEKAKQAAIELARTATRTRIVTIDESVEATIRAHRDVQAAQAGEYGALLDEGRAWAEALPGLHGEELGAIISMNGGAPEDCIAKLCAAIESLLAQLKTVLDREAATIARYDKRLAQKDAEIEQRRGFEQDRIEERDRYYGDLQMMNAANADLEAQVAALTARVEKLQTFVEWCAESGDTGRGDGLPEPCAAHDADLIWHEANRLLEGPAPDTAQPESGPGVG